MNKQGDTTTMMDIEARVFEVAGSIRAWQEARGMSAVKLIRQFPTLGSSKTFAKLAEGDSEGLDVASWLAKYEGVLRVIERETDEEEETWHDLGPTAALLTVGPQLLMHRGLNRLVICEGDSGSGKSRALQALKARHPGTVLVVEADESWKTPKAMVSNLLVGIGEETSVENITGDFLTRQNRLIDALKARRVMLCIDESQHMAAQGLTILKTLLNRTVSCFVIAGQSTLWRKLQATAWQEAKQLRHNRCFASLSFGAPAADDVELFVSRRAALSGGGGLDTLKDATWKALGDYAARYGGFAFLRDTVDQARREGPAGASLDDGVLLVAAETIKARAGGGR
jgi:hypothetical protein